MSLEWRAGDFAVSHDVYLGENFDDVNAGAEGTFVGNQALTSLIVGRPGFAIPDGLVPGTTYYWRIDEYNTDATISKGSVWSFTVADFIGIDDFESYNNLDPDDPQSNRIFNAWIDGFDNPFTNGSVVGYANPPFAEQTIVHSGNQSMPMSYDNGVGKSEATLTLTYPRDWTEKGVNTLTIWFRGDSANAAETN